MLAEALELPSGWTPPTWSRCAATTWAPPSLQLGDLDGQRELLRSVDAGARRRAITSTSCAPSTTSSKGCGGSGRYDEASAYIDQAVAYGRDRDFPVHALHVRRPPVPAARDARGSGTRRSRACATCSTGAETRG